jgi:hypothetical protein
MAAIVVVVVAAAATAAVRRVAGAEDEAVEGDVLDQQVVGAWALLDAPVEQVLEEGQVCEAERGSGGGEREGKKAVQGGWDSGPAGRGRLGAPRCRKLSLKLSLKMSLNLSLKLSLKSATTRLTTRCHCR